MRFSFGLLAALCCAQTGEFNVRVSVNQVQIEATVTGHGKPASDLIASDFRILLDGKPQPVTFCRFIGTPAASTSQARGENGIGALSTQPIRRQDVRRTVVFFVDDISLASESVPSIRTGLRRFIERQVQPGDLVAIVRASAGLGALQDFTTDRSRLLAAADQIRWNVYGRGNGQAYKQLGNFDNDDRVSSLDGTLDREIKNRGDVSSTLLATNALKRLLGGMKELPGRKAVVLFTGYMPLQTADDIDPGGASSAGTGIMSPILQSMRGVVDESVRAGVVLYAVDSRGLSSLRLGAADRAGPIAGLSIEQAMADRKDEYLRGQWGAMFLADETGGFMVTEANDISAALARVMSDGGGYYELGFTPPDAALARGRDGKPVFHRVKIEVTRAGLSVRSQRGFYGVADEELPPKTDLASLLESPFQQSGIGITATADYLNVSGTHGYIRTAVALDAHDLSLTGPEIHRSGVIHILVRAFGVDGRLLEGGIDRTLRIDLDDKGYAQSLRNGLIYNGTMPVDKPGPYQIRAACLDENTGKIGTTGDFIVVPKPVKNELVLTSIVLANSLGVNDHVRPAPYPAGFAAGDTVSFAAQLLNGSGGERMRMALYEDGVEKYSTPLQPVPAEAGRHGREGVIRGALQIPASFVPGEYEMLVEVTGGGNRFARRWTPIKLRAPSQR